MKNKTDIQTKNQQIDKILQEQYDAETKILGSALLNVAGKTSWDEFPEESEEKIRAGYDRLITRLRETGDFNEAARAEKTGSTRAAKEKLESLEYDGEQDSQNPEICSCRSGSSYVDCAGGNDCYS